MKKIVVLIFAAFLFVLPCCAKASFEIKQVSDSPDGVQVEITPTKNSFRVTRCKTSNDYYSLVMNDAVIITDDGITHRLVEPLSFDYVYTGKKFPNRSIYKEPFDFELVPLENIRYSKLLNQYPENVKIAQIGAFAYSINFNSKKSILKNSNFTIRIPVLNDTIKEITILEFRGIKK